MAADRLRLPLERLAAGRRTLDDAAARYLTRVHRAGEGTSFVAFDPGARLEADGRIEQLQRRQVIVSLGTPRAARHVPQQQRVLLQGLPKGSKLDAVMRDATELGATHLLATVCARSQPRLLSDAHQARCRRVAIEAARQCGRGDLPELLVMAALEDALAWCAAHAATSLRLALHPETDTALGSYLSEPAAGHIIAIGPEGGWSEDEITALTAADFRLARLGAFVMRTETAPAAALGAIAARS